MGSGYDGLLCHGKGKQSELQKNAEGCGEHCGMDLLIVSIERVCVVGDGKEREPGI